MNSHSFANQISDLKKNIKTIVFYLFNLFASLPSIHQIKISSSHYFLKSILNSKTPVVIDVGAHKGETVSNIKSININSVIYSFEPTPSSFYELEGLCSNYSNASAFQLLIGSVCESVEFSISDASPINSILPIASDTQLSTHWNVNSPSSVNKISVDCVTLDYMLGKLDCKHVRLLKIDTQGSELNVLQGAHHALSSATFDYIMLEYIVVKVYEGQPSLSQILCLMSDYNYTIYRIFDASYSRQGQLLQFDIVFARNNDN